MFKVSPAFFLLSALFLNLSCTSRTWSRQTLAEQAEVYAARIAFKWQNLTCFQIRGTARIEGRSLVARGAFVLWGDPANNLLRGDFFGPRGRPVVSLRADSTGVMLYMPGEEYAAFTPLGLRVGSGVILTRDLLFFIRTGFPLLLEPWVITLGAEIGGESTTWCFTLPEERASMLLTLSGGELFPSVCAWDSGYLSITAASLHDEYSAWPSKWIMSIDGDEVEVELTCINANAMPWAGVWDLHIPIPVDTVGLLPAWQPAWPIPRR